MDYNTTAVNSISNMYPTAYLSNSSKSASFRVLLSLIFHFQLKYTYNSGKWNKLEKAMPINIPSKRNNEDLPKSVEVEFVDRIRGLSWCVRFVLRRHLWNDSELPWQHIRWLYKLSNIENTNKVLLTTLWYNVVIEKEYK